MHSTRVLIVAAAITAACGGKRDKPREAERAEPAPVVIAPSAPCPPAAKPLDLSGGARVVLGGAGPRHGSDVSMVAFSADGCRVASIDADGEVFVWDVATGAPLERTAVPGDHGVVGFHGTTLVTTPPAGFQASTYSLDGRWLVEPRETGDAVYDVATATRVDTTAHLSTTFSIGGGTLAMITDAGVEAGPIAGPYAVITGIANKPYLAGVTPDGHRVAVTGEDRVLHVMAVPSGPGRDIKFEALSESDGISATAWHPDGRQLAVVTYSTVVGIVDTTTSTYRELARVPFANDIEHVTFSPDGRLVAAATKYGRVRVWNAETGAPVHPQDGHWGSVWSLAISDDGTTLASAGDERALVWSPGAKPTAIAELGDHEHWVTHVALDPAGARIASCSDYGDILVRALPAGTVLAKLQIPGSSCEGLAIRGSSIITSEGTRAQVFAIRDGATPREFPLAAGRKYGTSAFAVSRDGSLVATGGDDGALAIHTIDGTKRWRVELPMASGEDNERVSVDALAFDPTDKQLAALGSDDIVRVHDVRTGRIIRTIPITEGGVTTALAFAGPRLAVARSSGEVRVFDPAGKVVRTFRHRIGAVSSLVGTPTQLYVGGSDGSITGWDL